MTFSVALALLPKAGQAASRCEQIFDPGLNTSRLAEAFQPLEQRVWWGTGLHYGLEYRRFVDERDVQRTHGNFQHGLEAYGIETYRRWKKADIFLTNIPVGKLRMSTDLILKVHEIATDARVKPGFRTKQLLGAGPLRRSITETQLANLKANPHIRNFIELPWPISRMNARRGIILYRPAKDVPAAIDGLVTWFEENRQHLDPIVLAAEFQRRFVSIHPFVDGNGRTSRLLMDRILQEFNLPSPLIERFNDDIYETSEGWTQEIRIGIRRFLKETRKTPLQWSGSVQDLARFTIDKTKLKDGDIDSTWIANDGFGPTIPFAEFKIGGQRFVLGSDGMYFDRFGRPFIVNNKSLYPVSEKSYWLYHAVDKNDGGPSRSLRALREDGFKFAVAIKNGMINADQVAIAPTPAALTEANRDGALFLYSWQTEALNDALVMAASDPLKNLLPYDSSRTQFEQAATGAVQTARKTTFDAPSILAQYEYLDLQYSDYEAAARKFAPQLAAKANAARRELHRSALALMQTALSEFEQQTPDERKILQRLGPVKLFNAYLRRSKLGFASYDEARRKISDENVIALRSDIQGFKYTGLRTEDEWFHLIRRFPGSKPLIRSLQAIAQRLHKGDRDRAMMASSLDRIILGLQDKFPLVADALKRVSHRLLETPYSLKAVSEEMDRAFLMYTLHTIGDVSRRQLISMSTSTNLYDVGVQEGHHTAMPFVAPAFSGAVFILSAPRKHVDWNSGGVSIAEEYELFSRSPLSRRHILEVFRTEDLRVDVSKLSPTQSRVLANVFGFSAERSTIESGNVASHPETQFEMLEIKNAAVVTPDGVPVWQVPIDNPDLKSQNH